MKPLRLPKHERFAQLLAAGDTQEAAYRTVYRYTGTIRNARKLAYRLAARPDIAARIVYLQSRSARRVNWSLDERLNFLRQSTLTPPAEIDAASPLALGTRLTPHGLEVKHIDKLRALLLYSRLVGDLDPLEEEPAPSPLSEIIARIRAGKGGQA